VDEAVSLRTPHHHELPVAGRRAGGADLVENISDEPMPVSVGFHPYVKLTDSTGDE
jgi:hypothetical protein